MIERAPDGTINNCALANSDEEKNCQVCQGVCPDRPSRLSTWLTKKAQEDLDEHVRPEIQALAERGNVTPDEVAALRCNSWEWEHLVPAMNDEAFVGRVEHALANCGRHRRPFLTYDEAVKGLYAPELLRRFKLMLSEGAVVARAARDLGEALDNIRAALGQKETHYLVMSDDVAILVKALEWYASKADDGSARARVTLAVTRQHAIATTCETCGRKLFVVPAKRPEDDAPAVFCAECGGGCTSWPKEEVLP